MLEQVNNVNQLAMRASMSISATVLSLWNMEHADIEASNPMISLHFFSFDSFGTIGTNDGTNHFTMGRNIL